MLPAPGPAPRRRVLIVGGKQPFGQGPKLAQRLGHPVGPKPKAVFDPQRGVHPVEAVQADRIQGGLGPLLVFLQRTAQVFLDDLVDLLDRCRLDFLELQRPAALELAELARPRTEEEVVGDERGRFRTVPGCTRLPGRD